MPLAWMLALMVPLQVLFLPLLTYLALMHYAIMARRGWTYILATNAAMLIVFSLAMLLRRALLECRRWAWRLGGIISIVAVFASLEISVADAVRWGPTFEILLRVSTVCVPLLISGAFLTTSVRSLWWRRRNWVTQKAPIKIGGE